MKKILILTKRNLKELFRDPLSYIFIIAMPIFVLLLIQLIQGSLPNEAKVEMAKTFAINNFTPGIAVFGFSFLALFAAQILAKDRSSALLTRMYVSPLKPYEYIFGYTIPFIVFAVIQMILIFIVAMFFGLTISFNILLTMLVLFPIAIMFIGLGILIGSVFSEKQSSGITSFMVTICTLLSGIWFPIEIMPNGVKISLKIFPFYNSVEAASCAINGEYGQITVPILICLAYMLIVFVISTLVFKKKMRYK